MAKEKIKSDELSPKASASSGGAEEPPSDVPSIAVYGDFIDQVAVISRCDISLLLGVGELGDVGAVLVPFVQFKFEGPAQVEAPAETLLSKFITIDNAAFLIDDLLDDFRNVCEQLGKLAPAELHPESGRIEKTKLHLIQAKAHLEQCMENLGKISSRTPA